MINVFYFSLLVVVGVVVGVVVVVVGALQNDKFLHLNR
jgi:hypothetical protein